MGRQAARGVKLSWAKMCAAAGARRDKDVPAADLGDMWPY